MSIGNASQRVVHARAHVPARIGRTPARVAPLRYLVIVHDRVQVPGVPVVAKNAPKAAIRQDLCTNTRIAVVRLPVDDLLLVTQPQIERLGREHPIDDPAPRDLAPVPRVVMDP